MAIPNRTTITCPNCGTSEDVIIGDSSIGPGGRVCDTPIYTLLTRPLWDQTKRDGETWLSCTTCGTAEFITLAKQARRPQVGTPSKFEKPAPNGPVLP